MKNSHLIVILTLALILAPITAPAADFSQNLRPRGDGGIDSRDYGAPGQATLQAIKDFLGPNVRHVSLDPGTWTIASKFTATANMVLKPKSGAMLTVTIPDVAIANLSRANPCVVTWTGHGLATEDMVFFRGIILHNPSLTGRLLQ